MLTSSVTPNKYIYGMFYDMSRDQSDSIPSAWHVTGTATGKWHSLGFRPLGRSFNTSTLLKQSLERCTGRVGRVPG